MYLVILILRSMKNVLYPYHQYGVQPWNVVWYFPQGMNALESKHSTTPTPGVNFPSGQVSAHNFFKRRRWNYLCSCRAKESVKFVKWKKKRNAPYPDRTSDLFITSEAPYRLAKEAFDANDVRTPKLNHKLFSQNYSQLRKLQRTTKEINVNYKESTRSITNQY